nr:MULTISPECIES: restriction endonuclease subunit S [Vibrio]
MVKLGDVAPSRPLKNPKIEDAERVWQLNLDMVEANSGQVIEKCYQSLDKAGSSTHWFDANHVLYSKLRPYLNKVVTPDEQGLATTELVPLLPDPKRLDRYFLAYYLRSSEFVQWISEQVAGAKMPRVSMDLFWNHEIPLPPLAEQKRIAAILDKADAIRRKRQQAIQLADDFLRAVFLEMFGDPVTNPKGWEVKSFSELGKWASGGTPSRNITEYFCGNIDWYSAGELNTRYLSGSLEKITQDAIDNSATKLFPAGSMLIGMYDTAAFKISILNNDSCCNQACANVIPNESVDIEWLYSYLSYSKEHYLKARRGVRQKNLNLGMIKEFELPIPPKDLQQRFAALAKSVNRNLNSASQFSDVCNSLFGSISEKAFSGQL